MSKYDSGNSIQIMAGFTSLTCSIIVSIGCILSIIIHPNTSQYMEQILSTIVGYTFSEISSIKHAIIGNTNKSTHEGTASKRG